MACQLTSEFLCASVSNIRVAEDAISTVLLVLIISALIFTIFKIVKKGPLTNRLWGLIIGLVPFFLWKLLGTFRRVFLESSTHLYGVLDTFGEVMESISALFILASLIYLFLHIRTKKQPVFDTMHKITLQQGKKKK